MTEEIWEEIPSELLANDQWEEIPIELQLEMERENFFHDYQEELIIKTSLKIFTDKQTKDWEATKNFLENIDGEKFCSLLIGYLKYNEDLSITSLALTCKKFYTSFTSILPSLPNRLNHTGQNSDSDGIPKKYKRLFHNPENVYCKICDVRLNVKNYDEHINGKRHRKKMFKL